MGLSDSADLRERQQFAESSVCNGQKVPSHVNVNPSNFDRLSPKRRDDVLNQ